MNKQVLFDCNDKRIIDVVRLVHTKHNTKMNVFQNELGVSYIQTIKYIKLLEASGIYSGSKHYRMITTPDGKLKRKYCPYEIIVSDEEMAEVLFELEAFYKERI